MLRIDKKTGARVYDNFPSGTARHVICILYLEDWGISYGKCLDYMSELELPCAVSPIHDKDTWSDKQVRDWIRDHSNDDGILEEDAIKIGVPVLDHQKKPHVHLYMKSPSAHNSLWYYNLLLPFHEVKYFEMVNSPYKTIRYFAHMDNPEKHQYSALDIHGFGGFDLSPLVRNNETDKIYTFVNVMEDIEARHIHHYSHLVKYAISTGDLDFIACVAGRASTFANYFKSETDYFRIKKRWRELAKKYPNVTLDDLDAVFDL